MKKKALFLDRDGVINESAPKEKKYVLSPDDFHLRPSIIPLIRFARAVGYVVVVVTNQRPVSMGILSPAGLDDIHAYMRKVLAAHDASVDAVYACPHGFNECECRKPKAGLLLQAAQDLDIDLSESVMVGDHETDMEAGTAAGCKVCILVQ